MSYRINVVPLFSMDSPEFDTQANTDMDETLETQEYYRRLSITRRKVNMVSHRITLRMISLFVTLCFVTTILHWTTIHGQGPTNDDRLAVHSSSFHRPHCLVDNESDLDQARQVQFQLHVRSSLAIQAVLLWIASIPFSLRLLPALPAQGSVRYDLHFHFHRHLLVLDQQ